VRYMGSTISPHGIIKFVVCNDCCWTATVLNSDLCRISICPVCSGIIDFIPLTTPIDAKMVDFISVYLNMKHLYKKVFVESLIMMEARKGDLGQCLNTIHIC